MLNHFSSTVMTNGVLHSNQYNYWVNYIILQTYLEVDLLVDFL